MRHPNPRRIAVPLGAALLLGLLALAHLWQGFGSANLLLRTLQNSLHLPAFAILGFFVAGVFTRLRPVAAFLICLGVAVILESAQVMTERDASLADLVVDGVGIVLGLLIARGRPGDKVLGVLILAIATAWSPVQVWRSKIQQHEMFPLLLDSRLIHSRLLDSDSSLERTDGNGIRVCLEDGPFPGVLVNEPPRQWRGYGTLALRFTVEGSEALRMTVAIGYLSTPGTSATVSEVFAPGTHTWEIPVSELQAEGELISYFKVHSSRKYAGQCFVLASVGLR
jgi:hypothetical protein